MADRYSAQVFWSDEDEGFVATVPELPGCCVVGVTRLHAMIELEDAIEAWIEGARAVGKTIPEGGTVRGAHVERPQPK